MDVGTGRSGEGVFPPVPLQAQAGFEAGCPTTHPLREESFPHTEASWKTLSMTQQQLLNTWKALSLLVWWG